MSGQEVDVAQRVVLLDGRNTFLLYGDPEIDDTRWLTNSNAGTNLPSALPQLLSAGWSIETIVALPHFIAAGGSGGPYAVIVLKSGDTAGPTGPQSPLLS
jgi:hypothetical protein